MAFEGLGWETDLMAYRLYLDSRAAVDIFGKRQPEPVLHTIGMGADDYHALADWGMDVFKVGDTVGLGGVALLRGDKATQIGPSVISVKLYNQPPTRARAEVTFDKVEGRGQIKTTYAIQGGSALTHVTATGRDLKHPLVTGFIRHPDTTLITPSKDESDWTYVATWGTQSLNNDALGIAVFVRKTDLSRIDTSGGTVYLTFKNPNRMDYAFAAVWTLDRQGVHNEAAFRQWLETTRKGLP